MDGSQAQAVGQAWNARGAGSVQLPASRPPDQLNVRFEISQSGMVFPIGYGAPNPPPLVDGFPGHFEKMSVTPLNPGTGDPKAEYPLNDQGVLKPRTGQRPLGPRPYQITLLAKDGSQWSGQVDVSPQKVGWSGHGYVAVNVHLTRDIPPPPPEPTPPARLENVAFHINQSGRVFPLGYENSNPKPLVPGFKGFFNKLEITARDQVGWPQVAFDITQGGVVVPDCHQPLLGKCPYTVTLVGKNGQRWAADVDVSPKKVGWSGQGYEPVNVTFTKEE